MSLHAALTRVKTEEDVKDAYIEALGLKGALLHKSHEGFIS